MNVRAFAFDRLDMRHSSKQLQEAVLVGVLVGSEGLTKTFLVMLLVEAWTRYYVLLGYTFFSF